MRKPGFEIKSAAGSQGMARATQIDIGSFISRFAASVLRQILVTSLWAGPTVAFAIGIAAAQWVAPFRGSVVAVIVAIAALSLALVCTAWFVTALAVLRGAAHAAAMLRRPTCKARP